MVVRNRNRVVHFSYGGNKELEYSLLGTSPAVKAVQEGPLYPFGKWNHVKILGFSRVTCKHQNPFTFTRKSRRSRFTCKFKKNSRGNVFKFSYLSFAQAVLFGLIDLVFRSHQVV